MKVNTMLAPYWTSKCQRGRGAARALAGDAFLVGDMGYNPGAGDLAGPGY